MKIAVIGGTGMVGSRVVAEAVARGHAVTSVSRGRQSPEQAPGVGVRQLDVTDSAAVRDLAADHDVVVAAFGPSRVPGEDPAAFTATFADVADAVEAAGSTRLAVVGGAGSLFAAPGVRLVDTAEFPPEYKAEALAHAAALDALRSSDTGLDWTYLSPAPVIAPGERTGEYRTGLEEPVGMQISVEDLAVALLDELETPQHTRARFTVAS